MKPMLEQSSKDELNLVVEERTQSMKDNPWPLPLHAHCPGDPGEPIGVLPIRGKHAF